MMQQAEAFDQLKRLLEPYGKTLVNKSSNPANYELYSIKKIEAMGKERNEMFFAGLMPKKGYIGFYFMPIYTHPAEFTNVPAELKKCLKGKSCFHIKKSDPVVASQVEQLLRKGYEVYKKEGWI